MSTFDVYSDHVDVVPLLGYPTVTVTNNAGGAVYYADSLNVSASNNQGSISAGSSVTFSQTTYVVSASRSTMSVSWAAVPTQDITLGTDGKVGGPGGTGLTSSVVSDSSGDANSPVLAATANRNRALRDFRSLQEYSTKASGNDWTAAFNQVITDLGAGGKKLYVPGSSSVYGISSKVTCNIPIQWIGDGPGSTVVSQLYDGTLISAAGSQAAGISLSVNANIGDTALTFASAGTIASLAVGQELRLWSSQAWTGAVNGATHGELVRVASISSNVVTLEAPIGDSYTTANSAQVQILTYLDGLVFDGITFQNPSPRTRNSVPYALQLTLLRNFRSHACQFIGLDGPAFQISDCIDFKIYEPDFRDLTNDPANNRFGYGVNVNNLSLNGLVHGLTCDRARHAFTTNGGAGGGVPRHIICAHGTARHMIDPVSGVCEAAFDTHPEGEFITFDSCHVESTEAYAFKTRSPYTSFVNCFARDIKGAGIYLQQENGQGNPINCLIDGGEIRDLTDISGVPGRGVVAEGDNVTIKNLVIVNTTYEGIYIGNPTNNTPNQNSKIESCELVNVGQTATVGINFNNQAASTGHRLNDIHVEGNSTTSLVGGIKADTNVSIVVMGRYSNNFVTSDFTGAGTQTKCYINSSGQLITNALFNSTNTVQSSGAFRATSTSQGFFEFAKQASDPAGSGTTARLYTRDDGSGNPQMAVVLGTGSVRVLGDARENGYAGILAPSGEWAGNKQPVLCTASRALFARFVPDRDMTITKLAFGLKTAATANDNCDVGIFDSTLTTLLGSAGSTAGKLNGATGQVQVSLAASVSLTAGKVYYAAFAYGTVGGTAATIIQANVGDSNAWVLFGNSAPNLVGGFAAQFPLANSPSINAGIGNIACLAVLL